MYSDERAGRTGRPPGPKRVCRAWLLWEQAFERLWRVEDPGGPDCLLRVALRRYGGPPCLLADGTTLARGDLVGELHMKNEHIQALTAGEGAGRSVVLTLKAARKSLPILAAVLRSDPRYREVRALVGYTMLHRGIRRIGFSVFELSWWTRTLIGFYERWLIAVYHRDGWHHVRRHWRKLVPKLVAISRNQLLSRYGPPE